ncbi:hypothetical protein ZWY2020_049757 [Hordeum vulgare]|nr:hypothetical protein ZWY2020_049757 [Hordeum vulgare]
MAVPHSSSASFSSPCRPSRSSSSSSAWPRSAGRAHPPHAAPLMPLLTRRPPRRRHRYQQCHNRSRTCPPPVTWAKPRAPEPRQLAWREVEALTGGFEEASVVGRAGSGGALYLSRIPAVVGGLRAAVIMHQWCGGGERQLGAFRCKLDLLRRVGRHPRLVALLPYSNDHGKYSLLHHKKLKIKIKCPSISLSLHL